MRKKIRVKFSCENCGKEKEIKRSDFLKSKNHFCSSRCAYDGRKGENNPSKRIEVRKKISENVSGEKHGQWKGNKVGYKGLHEWIRTHKPKPLFCEDCKKLPPKNLANLSGEYRRDINDFKWLCCKCHIKLDIESHKRDKFGRFIKKGEELL